MKTTYKFVHFEWVDGAFDGYWKCVNSKYILGKVRWYQELRKFCFSPERNIVFSEDCLGDISDFIKQLGGKDEKRS